MRTMDRKAFVRRAGLVGGTLAVLEPLEAFSARKALGAPLQTTGYRPARSEGRPGTPDRVRLPGDLPPGTTDE